MIKKKILLSSFILFLLLSTCTKHENGEKLQQVIEADVCVYTATSSGILAALAVKREGRSVVIVEPSRWVGGILGAGIKPIQDCPNFEAVGGTTREIMKILGIREKLEDTTSAEIRSAIRTMSPKDIREDFLKLLEDKDIRVVYEHRIKRCVKRDQTITQSFFDLAPFDESGCPIPRAETPENLQVKAKIFIDASYEGELMARAGISYRTGRESSLDYHEETAGVREPSNLTPIDPFVVEGNPQSGLLPLVELDHDKPLGASDHYTQAYNFRYYVTSNPEYRVAIEPPDNFRAEDYELVGRYVDYLKQNTENREDLFEQLDWIFPGWMNAGEYNYQRNSLITMAPVGISHLYINGDYATKARIWKYHQDYLRGLHHFMSTDSRVPEEFREQTASLGLDLRHHSETNGWPHQLYIRVSRRMVGGYTITAHDVYNRTIVNDPIGLAQYGIDTYPARRIIVERDGQIYVALEGKMFVGGAIGPTNIPYPIPYRAITPMKHECTNLLVPVCFSATHLGYASARMEPVFMICGESAGMAAVQAINEGSFVQEIDIDKYINKLRKRGQRLKWPLSEGI